MFLCTGLWRDSDTAGWRAKYQPDPPADSHCGLQDSDHEGRRDEFTGQAVILWNGSTLATSMVDSNTLVGTVESSSLAVPAVVQLKVQNLQTGKESRPVPVTVASAAWVCRACLWLDLGDLHDTVAFGNDRQRL